MWWGGVWWGVGGCGGTEWVEVGRGRMGWMWDGGGVEVGWGGMGWDGMWAVGGGTVQEGKSGRFEWWGWWGWRCLRSGR